MKSCAMILETILKRKKKTFYNIKRVNRKGLFRFYDSTHRQCVQVFAIPEPSFTHFLHVNLVRKKSGMMIGSLHFCSFRKIIVGNNRTSTLFEELKRHK